MSLDSMDKKMQNSRKTFTEFSPQRKKTENLNVKVLDNVGDLSNELYYIYEERHEEEKDALNKKDTKKFDFTKLRLAYDYLHDSEEEDKQTHKKPDKKEPFKKPQKVMLKNLVN